MSLGTGEVSGDGFGGSVKADGLVSVYRGGCLFRMLDGQPDQRGVTHGVYGAMFEVGGP